MTVYRVSKGRFIATLAAAAAVSAALASPASAALTCTNSSGDVVAYPLIINKGSQSIPQGATIFYSVKMANTAPVNGSFVLKAALAPNKSVRADKYYHWNHTCTAWTGSFIKGAASKKLYRKKIRRNYRVRQR